METGLFEIEQNPFKRRTSSILSAISFDNTLSLEKATRDRKDRKKFSIDHSNTTDRGKLDCKKLSQDIKKTNSDYYLPNGSTATTAIPYIRDEQQTGKAPLRSCKTQANNNDILSELMKKQDRVIDLLLVQHAASQKSMGSCKRNSKNASLSIVPAEMASVNEELRRLNEENAWMKEKIHTLTTAKSEDKRMITLLDERVKALEKISLPAKKKEQVGKPIISYRKEVQHLLQIQSKTSGLTSPSRDRLPYPSQGK